MVSKTTLSRDSFNFLLLTLISRSPVREMRLDDIIYAGLDSDWLTQSERDSVPSRTDSQFANKVHNVVSHRGGKTCIIRRGVIDWRECDDDQSAFAITAKGEQWLAKGREKLGLADSTDRQALSTLMRQLRKLRE
jgi:hypothetical protein